MTLGEVTRLLHFAYPTWDRKVPFRQAVRIWQTHLDGITYTAALDALITCKREGLGEPTADALLRIAQRTQPVS